jgi:hypothetical protein
MAAERTRKTIVADANTQAAVIHWCFSAMSQPVQQRNPAMFDRSIVIY